MGSELLCHLTDPETASLSLVQPHQIQTEKWIREALKSMKHHPTTIMLITIAVHLND